MKSFRQYIQEANMMTLARAREIFNIQQGQPVPDLATLKTMYRTLAKQKHPDRGGTDLAMADVSNAWDVLQKFVGSTESGEGKTGPRWNNTRNDDSEERKKHSDDFDKKWRAERDQHKAQQEASFPVVQKHVKKISDAYNDQSVIQEFETYLSKQFGQSVKMTSNDTTVGPVDWQLTAKYTTTRQFTTDDRNTVLTAVMVIGGHPHVNPMKDETDYINDSMFKSDGMQDYKTVKIVKYQSVDTKTMKFNPEEIFPAKILKKFVGKTGTQKTVKEEKWSKRHTVDGMRRLFGPYMKETAYQGMTAINFTITLVDDWKSNNTITVQRGKFGARGYGRESGGQYISVSAPRVLMSQLSGGSTYLPENQKSFNLIVNLINTLRQVAHNKDQMAHIWQMFVQSAKAQQMKDAE